MSKNYSSEVIDNFINDDVPSIFVLKDGSVHVGILKPGYGRGHVHCQPLTINDGGVGFARNAIKQIVLFNGLIFPKEKGEKHTLLTILELNDLINKAGYEFI